MLVPCVCHNPACAKPFSVNPSDIKQGKGKYCSKPCSYTHPEKVHRGDRNHLTKLSDAQLPELLALRGTLSRRAAAKLFGISRSQVSRIWAGLSRRPFIH
jgi:hypothetical protein